MITENKIERLRDSAYNRDALTIEMLDTLELLWKVARAARRLDKAEPKISQICGIRQALAAVDPEPPKQPASEPPYICQCGKSTPHGAEECL